jgi:hypothetical protein
MFIPGICVCAHSFRGVANMPAPADKLIRNNSRLDRGKELYPFERLE